MENRITAITVQKKNPERINIHVDGVYAFSLSRIVGAWLMVGQPISDQKKSELMGLDDLERAFQGAVHFISFRSRSENEVKQNLRKKEFSDLVIDKTTEKLKSAGLINDEDFARQWVENRSTLKPRSRRLMEFELRQKKVAQQEIQNAFELLPDETILARMAAKKKISQFDHMDKMTFTKKMATYLSGKGFGYEIIKQVSEQIWNEKITDRKIEATK